MVKTEIEIKKEPPRWHKDAKWVSGIILFISMVVFFGTYDLYVLTTRENAVPALGLTLAINYSRTGLDDPKDINEVVDKAKKDGQTAIQPIPQLDIKINLKDIEGRSPRDVRLFFFNKIGEKIYDQDKSDLKELGLFGVINKNTNLLFRNALVVLSIIPLLSLLALIFFSHRFGKIVSPALVVFLVVFPQAAFWGMMQTIVSNSRLNQTNFVPEGKSIMEVVSFTLYNILGVVTKSLVMLFLIILTVCLVLFSVALILKIIFRKKLPQKEDKTGIDNKRV
ncbi:MAG: hypothetical protein WC437_01960 [Patescibacteria group bacterium]|jgi:hypothetical protein